MNMPTYQPNLKAQKSNFSFLNELRRPRSEDKNEATLSQPKNKLGTPWMQNKNVSQEQVTVNIPKTNQPRDDQWL